MEHNDNHWHWWYWIIVIIITIMTLAITYTIVHNYEIVKQDNKTVTNSTQEIVDHPIKSTENIINDVAK